jgi:hypothetical protein
MIREKSMVEGVEINERGYQLVVMFVSHGKARQDQREVGDNPG